jgi:hypothetical protein
VRPYLEKNPSQKRVSGVSQGVGPELQKKKKKKKLDRGEGEVLRNLLDNLVTLMME